MAVIDLVKWDGTPDIFAWRFPSEELSTWTQLIVAESQEAVLIKAGKLIGPFTVGRHTLSTENIPLISQLFKVPFGGRTPFTAEVWFVNKAIPLDIKWGTPDPIQLLDPKYKVMLPIRSFGQFGIQVEHTKKFIVKLVGTLPTFDRPTLASYFRGIMISWVKDTIAKKIVKDNISILEISANITEISHFLQTQIADELSEFGVKLIKFTVSSINVPEDDQAVIQLKGALAKKAEMDIVGYTYQQERSFDTIETAAGNPGQGSAGLMGAGMGLGMGLGFGGAMGGAASAMASQLQFGTVQQHIILCPECRTRNRDEAKFCSNCATSLIEMSPQKPQTPKEQQQSDLLLCDKCANKSPKGSQFCINCGDPFNLCPKCGTDNPNGEPFCIECASPMPINCPKCDTELTSESKFCKSCGEKIQTKCPKCESLIPLGAKFCPSCGSQISPMEE